MTTPHKAMLIQARDALLSACGGRCNAEYNPCDYKEVADALTAAIDAPEPEPEPEPEPVAWLDPWTQAHCSTDYDAYGRHGIPLHKHPPAVREPLSDAEIHEWWARDNGLEDVDMCKLADFTQVIRAIEAALRAKP